MNSFEDQLTEELFSPKLKSFAYTFCKNQTNVDDLIQATALRALEYKDRFDGLNMTGWIRTIMRNVFINEFRYKKARPTTLCEDAGIYSKATVVNEYENKADKNRLEMAITKISKSGAQAISLELAGYSYAEIADRLHVPVGTVKTRIFNAKDDIKKVYCGKTRRKIYKETKPKRVRKPRQTVNVVRMDNERNELNVFDSATIAALEHGISPQAISAAISEQHSAGGFKWKKKELCF